MWFILRRINWTILFDATMTSPVYLKSLQQSVIPSIREDFKDKVLFSARWGTPIISSQCVNPSFMRSCQIDEWDEGVSLNTLSVHQTPTPLVYFYGDTWRTKSTL